MKILFIGDSITNGKIGDCFVKRISDSSDDIQTTNLGKDGETLNIIAERLLNHLKLYNDYDYCVVQGGYNDIILPFFNSRDGLFKKVYNKQIALGYHPFTDADKLKQFIIQLINNIQKLFKGKIILLTIGCVGEDLNSSLNFQRNLFNDIIRKSAIETGIICADTQIEFDNILKGEVQSSYCMDNLFSVIWWDKLYTKTEFLSKKRNLFLTIDGVHLNTSGAKIFAKCIIDKLKL